MRLLYLDIEGINKLSEEYERDTKALKSDLYRMCWWMRGALSFSESFNLTLEDRDIINEIIKDNIKITKEENIPFF